MNEAYEAGSVSEEEEQQEQSRLVQAAQQRRRERSTASHRGGVPPASPGLSLLCTQPLEPSRRGTRVKLRRLSHIVIQSAAHTQGSTHSRQHLLSGFVKVAEKVAQQSEGSRQSQVAQQCLAAAQALLIQETSSLSTNTNTSSALQHNMPASNTPVACKTRVQEPSQLAANETSSEAARHKQRYTPAVCSALRHDIC
jgi:hypothetical protein